MFSTAHKEDFKSLKNRLKEGCMFYSPLIDSGISDSNNSTYTAIQENSKQLVGTFIGTRTRRLMKKQSQQISLECPFKA
jgi:hypothetical protein